MRAVVVSPAQVAVSLRHTGAIVETRRWGARTLLQPAARWEHIAICADTFGGLQTETEQSRSPVSFRKTWHESARLWHHYLHSFNAPTSLPAAYAFLYVLHNTNIRLNDKDKLRERGKCRKSIKCKLNKLWEGNNAELNRVKSHIILLLRGGGRK